MKKRNPLLWLLAGWALFSLVTCTTSEDKAPTLLDIKLDDSLTREADRFDTLQVDLLYPDSSAFREKAFYGIYRRNAEGKLKDIDLGSRPPVDYLIRIIAYKAGEKKLAFVIRMKDGMSIAPVVVFRDPGLPPGKGDTTAAGDTTHPAIGNGKGPEVVIDSPKKGFLTSDSQVTVAWRVGKVEQTRELVEKLGGKQGKVLIIRMAKDSTGRIGADTIEIERDTVPPGKPVFRAGTTASPTNQGRPRWVWESGKGGNGTYRYSFTGGPFAILEDSTYQPQAQEDGTYSLSVAERDAAGNWSDTASLSITVKRTGPDVRITSPAPGFMTNAGGVEVVWSVDKTPHTDFEDLSGKTGRVPIARSFTDAAGNRGVDTVFLVVDRVPPAVPVFTDSTTASPTRNLKPTWAWKSGGGGKVPARFRYQFDGAAWVETADSSFMPTVVDGIHTLKVAERDSAGNWSSEASRIVVVKGSAPLAPVLSHKGSPTNAPRWDWKSGGGGDGVFRVKLDSAKYPSAGSAVLFLAPANITPDGSHTLCVQERDTVGWGEEKCLALIVDRTGTKPVLVKPEVMARVGRTNPVFEGTLKANADLSGIRKLEYRINTQAAVAVTLTEESWSFTPKLDVGLSKVWVVAEDKSGNRDSASVLITKVAENIVFVRKGATGSGDSWSNAYGELSKALADSLARQLGAQLWVTEGIYSPPTGGSFTIKPGVSLYGGFNSDGTGKGLGDRNVGLKVEGYKTILAINQSDLSGAKIEITGIDKANPKQNVTIDGISQGGPRSSASYEEASIAIQNASVSLSNCLVRFSSGVFATNSDLDIKKCLFKQNLHYAPGGGAIYISGGTANISDCDFIENDGNALDGNGGAIFGDNATLDITGCVFSQNQSSTGGAVHLNGGTTFIKNSLFVGNDASVGSDLSISSGTAYIQNSTLFDFVKGGSNHSGISFEGNGGNRSNLQLKNTILWCDSTYFYNTVTSSTDGINQNSIEVINSIIMGGTSGMASDSSIVVWDKVGNSRVRPNFKDPGIPAGADGIFRTIDDGFMLNSGPGVNMGDGTNPLPTDITGEPRVKAGTIDIGAYER